MIGLIAETITQAFYNFEQDAIDYQLLQKALDIELVDGDLEPLNRVFTYSQITPDKLRLVEIANSEIHVYELENGRLPSPLTISFKDNATFRGLQIINAKLSNNYLAIYVNSTENIVIEVLKFEDYSWTSYQRAFFTLSVSTTQYNTTKCNGQLRIYDSAIYDFIVTLGCPEAEIMVVTGNNVTNITTTSTATGCVLVISGKSQTIFGVFPTATSTSLRSGANSLIMGGNIYASSNTEYILSSPLLFLLNTTQNVRFSSEKSITGEVVGSRYITNILIDGVDYFLCSSESIDFSAVVYDFDNELIVGIVDSQIRSLQRLKVIENNEYGAMFNSKDAIHYLQYSDLEPPYVMNQTGLLVEKILRVRPEPEEEQVKIMSYATSLQETLNFKDQLSIKYDLLMDSTYRDMDYCFENGKLLAYVFSPIFPQGKEIVLYEEVDSFTAPSVSDLKVFVQEESELISYSASVEVGQGIQIEVSTTYTGDCSDIQFSMGANKAVLSNMTQKPEAGKCKYTALAPLKASSFTLSLYSFETLLPDLTFEVLTTPTATYEISQFTVKPMIIRMNQNFSIRVEMLDLYGNDLKSTEEVCESLYGIMYLANEQYSNNPYVEDIKTYDDLTGEEILINGQSHITFKLLNNYCIYNMSGFSKSAILFVKLFKTEGDDQIVPSTDIRESLMIPINEIPKKKFVATPVAIFRLFVLVFVLLITLLLIPFLLYRCVNPKVPDLVKPQFNVLTGELNSTNNLLESSRVSSQSANEVTEGLGEVKLRGEPVINKMIKPVDLEQIQLTPQETEILNSKISSDIGVFWESAYEVSENELIQNINFLLYGQSTIFISLFDSLLECKNYEKQLVFQSKIKIPQLKLIESSVISVEELQYIQELNVLLKYNENVLLCIYSESQSAKDESAQGLEQQLDALHSMIPHRAFMNEEAIVKTENGVLLGPGRYFGQEYLVNGCSFDTCKQDSIEVLEK